MEPFIVSITDGIEGGIVRLVVDSPSIPWQVVAPFEPLDPKEPATLEGARSAVFVDPWSDVPTIQDQSKGFLHLSCTGVAYEVAYLSHFLCPPRQSRRSRCFFRLTVTVCNPPRHSWSDPPLAKCRSLSIARTRFKVRSCSFSCFLVIGLS